MIVDDDADDIFFFIEAAREVVPACTCLSAKNGLEALEQLKAMPIAPSHIFVDLNMPKLGGKQFIYEVRQIPAYAAIKLILYSTSNLHRDEMESRMAGADGYFTKPTSYDDLCKGIARFLNADNVAITSPSS
jgi:CheY-like chemotaxis protein